MYYSFFKQAVTDARSANLPEFMQQINFPATLSLIFCFLLGVAFEAEKVSITQCQCPLALHLCLESVGNVEAIVVALNMMFYCSSLAVCEKPRNSHALLARAVQTLPETCCQKGNVQPAALSGWDY